MQNGIRGWDWVFLKIRQIFLRTYPFETENVLKLFFLAKFSHFFENFAVTGVLEKNEKCIFKTL